MMSGFAEFLQKLEDTPTFFEVGETYMVGGYPHTVLAVADCLYGPLAWATFPRGNGLDCQTLCQAHFEESTVITPIDVLPQETEECCNGICVTAGDLGLAEYGDIVAYPHPDCPEHGDPQEEYSDAEICAPGEAENLRYVREEDVL